MRLRQILRSPGRKRLCQRGNFRERTEKDGFEDMEISLFVKMRISSEAALPGDRSGLLGASLEAEGLTHHLQGCRAQICCTHYGDRAVRWRQAATSRSAVSPPWLAWLRLFPHRRKGPRGESGAKGAAHFSPGAAPLHRQCTAGRLCKACREGQGALGTLAQGPPGSRRRAGREHAEEPLCEHLPTRVEKPRPAQGAVTVSRDAEA